MSTFRQNCALFLQSDMMGGKIVGNIFDSKEKQKPGCSGHYSLFKHRKKVLLKKKKKEKNKLDDHPPTFMPHHGMFLQLPPPMKKCRLVFDNKEHQCSDQLTSRGFQQGGRQKGSTMAGLSDSVILSKFHIYYIHIQTFT